MPEGQTHVYTISATDADNLATLTYTLAGTDSRDFIYEAGSVQFASAPDFENPVDANIDNQYQLDLIASDGTHNATLVLNVTVTDIQDTNMQTDLQAPQLSIDLAPISQMVAS